MIEWSDHHAVPDHQWKPARSFRHYAFFAARVAAAFCGAAFCAAVLVVRAVTPICASLQQLLLPAQRDFGDLHILRHPLVHLGEVGVFDGAYAHGRHCGVPRPQYFDVGSLPIGQPSIGPNGCGLGAICFWGSLNA